MLKKLTTATASDLHVGMKYVQLICHIDGTLSLDVFVPLTVPDIEGFFTAHITFTRADGSVGTNVTDLYHLETIGCPRGARKLRDTCHRTFAYTEETYHILTQLVEKQDRTAWFSYLGIINPDKKFVHAREAHARHIESLYGRGRLQVAGRGNRRVG